MSCSRMGLLLTVVGSLLLGLQVAKGDFIFGEPVPVVNLNTASADTSPCMTPDGLELYFASNRNHGADLCYQDIWVVTRAAIDEPWAAPVNLGERVNRPYGSEVNLSLSADGLELYFDDGWPPLSSGCDCRPGGHGRGDIWVSKRESRDAAWGTPINLGSEINSFEYDGTAHISGDGLSLYFCSARTAGHGFDLYVSTRATKKDPWGPPEELGAPINTMAAQDYLSYPFLSPDGLFLFFSSAPFDYQARGDIYMSTRATVTDTWGKPSRLAALNSTKHDTCVTFCASDPTIYFVRSDPYNPNASYEPALATFDLWQAAVAPILDLNGDGTVDCADVCILVDHWHTYDAWCDIAPPPLGDGFVDVQDLVLLVEEVTQSTADANDINTGR
ncbi:MAG: PD40 domain-containing protein [Sedimentisphaerales bacterium]|nr:PD40 domain-containing protein [Sedimentisphaerales bacterium]